MATAPQETRSPRPLTYRQLFSMSESDTEAKAAAIVQAYLKLRKHFEKLPTEVHMVTWPESLMDLSPQELCKAFEEAQRAEYSPTAGVLWGIAQRDRDAVRNDTFTEHWRTFLVALRKHGWEWRDADYRVSGPTAEHPTGRYEKRPPPVLDVEFEIALEKAWGCKLEQARRSVYMTHPDCGVVVTNDPGLTAFSIEKRVREAWMRLGRP